MFTSPFSKTFWALTRLSQTLMSTITSDNMRFRCILGEIWKCRGARLTITGRHFSLFPRQASLNNNIQTHHSTFFYEGLLSVCIYGLGGSYLADGLPLRSHPNLTSHSKFFFTTINTQAVYCENGLKS